MRLGPAVQVVPVVMAVAQFPLPGSGIVESVADGCEIASAGEIVCPHRLRHGARSQKMPGLPGRQIGDFLFNATSTAKGNSFETAASLHDPQNSYLSSHIKGCTQCARLWRSAEFLGARSCGLRGSRR